MPRSRMIKPEFWDDEKLCSISLPARLIFIGLWTYSDDYGVVKGNPIWLKNKILPYDGSLSGLGTLTEDSVSPHGIVECLSELEKIRCIIPFECCGENFYYIRNFTKHQKVNRPSKTRNPEPPKKILEASVRAHGALTDETETETETENNHLELPDLPLSKSKQQLPETSFDDSEENSMVLNHIEALCGKILQLPQKKKNFDPRKWAQEKIDRSGNPKAILHCLDGLMIYWDTTHNPWGWCNKLFEKQNGNYNEQDSIALHQKLKKMSVSNLGQLNISGIQDASNSG